MKRYFLLSALASFSLISCEPKEKKQEITATGQKELTPVPAPESNLKEEAEAFLNNWLHAQVKGDFESYSSCYHPDMEGIKRASVRTYRYNRTDWLKDRKNMFRKPMVVKATDLKTEIVGNSVVFRFVQTFETGTFKDKGQKQLVALWENGSYKIIKEEMLNSVLVGEKGEQFHGHIFFPAKSVGELMMIETIHSKAQIKKTVRKELDADYAFVMEEADRSSLSAGNQNWIGKKILAGNFHGDTAILEINNLYILHEVRPHKMMLEAWENLSEDTVIQDIKEIGISRLCAGFIERPIPFKVEWLVEYKENSPQPVAYKDSFPEEEEIKLAFTYLSNVPEFIDLKKQHKLTDSEILEKQLEVTVYKSTRKEVFYIIRCFGFSECGRDYFDLNTMWKKEGQDLKLIHEKLDYNYANLIDFNADGFPELLFEEEYFEMYETHWKRVKIEEVPFYGCGC